MASKTRIISLLEFVGEDDVKMQPLAQCMTNISTVKGGSRITFDTNQLSPTEVAMEKQKMTGLIVWVPKAKADA